MFKPNLHLLLCFSSFFPLGVDFHWYRLDNNGRWSHKPGDTRPTDRDNAGNQITDPRAAALGRYQFVSFMTSDINDPNVRIAGTSSCFLRLLKHACRCLFG